MDKQPINRKDDPRWTVLGAYVRDIADRMGLGIYRWTIEDLSDDDPAGFTSNGDEQCAAVAEPMNGYKAFRIKIGEPFFRQSPAVQRQIVVHELCHVIDQERQRVVGGLEHIGVMGAREYSLLAVELTYATESVIDWFATLIAPQYPLPVWAEAGTEGAVGY